MYYKRWYDNNETLRKIIESIGSHPDSDSIAIDIIQLMFQKQQNKDDFLETINKEFIDQRGRWYDKDYMFHSAIEMLKLLPNELAERILKETVSCWNFDIETNRHEDLHRN